MFQTTNQMFYYIYDVKKRHTVCATFLFSWSPSESLVSELMLIFPLYPLGRQKLINPGDTMDNTKNNNK